MLHTEQPRPPKTGRDNLTPEEIKEIKARHTDISAADLRLFMSLPRISLINFALLEKSAKNRIYYFILETDMYDKFVEYCNR